MPVTLPIDVYEVFEEAFGKDSAHKVVKSLESVISDSTDYKWNVTKDELLDAIRKEFITRELFDEKLNLIRIEIKERFNVVDERFNVVDEKFKSLNFKLNIFIAIALLALTLANPTFVRLIEKLF
jgi:hypothetical protein